jgi:hypothetical protein
LHLPPETSIVPAQRNDLSIFFMKARQPGGMLSGVRSKIA